MSSPKELSRYRSVFRYSLLDLERCCLSVALVQLRTSKDFLFAPENAHHNSAGKHMRFSPTSKRILLQGAARSSTKRRGVSGASYISGLDPSLINFNQKRQVQEAVQESAQQQARSVATKATTKGKKQERSSSTTKSSSSESRNKKQKSKSRAQKREEKNTKSKRTQRTGDNKSSSETSSVLNEKKAVRTRVSDSVRAMAFQIPDPETIQRQLTEDIQKQEEADRNAREMRERREKVLREQQLRREVLPEEEFVKPIVYTAHERPETQFRTRITAGNGRAAQERTAAKQAPMEAPEFPKHLVDRQYEEMMRRRNELEETRRNRFLQKLGTINIVQRTTNNINNVDSNIVEGRPQVEGAAATAGQLREDDEPELVDEDDDNGRPLSDAGEEINDDEQDDLLERKLGEKGLTASRYQIHPSETGQTSNTGLHNNATRTQDPNLADRAPTTSSVNAPVAGLSQNVRLTVDISEFDRYDDFHKHQLRQIRRDLESSATLARSVRNMIQIRGKSEEIPLSALPENLFGYAIMKTFSVGALLTAKRMTMLSCYPYAHPHSSVAPPSQSEISMVSPIRLESIITSGKSVKLMNGTTNDGRRVVVKWYKGEKRDSTYEIEGYRRLGSPPPFLSGDYRILGDRVIIMEPCQQLDGSDDPYEVARQVLPQLGKLHRFACHSDIKPGNIMKREVVKEGRRRWEYLMIDLGGIAVERSGIGYRRIVWSPKWTSQPRQRGIITTPLHDFIELGYTMKGIRLLAETESHADDEPVRSNFSGRLKKFMEVLSRVPPEKSFSDDLRMRLIEIVSRKPTAGMPQVQSKR